MSAQFSTCFFPTRWLACVCAWDGCVCAVPPSLTDAVVVACVYSGYLLSFFAALSGRCGAVWDAADGLGLAWLLVLVGRWPLRIWDVLCGAGSSCSPRTLVLVASARGTRLLSLSGAAIGAALSAHGAAHGGVGVFVVGGRLGLSALPRIAGCLPSAVVARLHGWTFLWCRRPRWS
eukprot:TRINITY_DN2267_c0_g2_i2.p2 TRINITY_DN2267_c0_g2~~TRINITY_DN2267_c0_g2_i2.p2  ORF type:complete len:176 (-),score=16.48 TRINITY_DN2267_c0_g2_i2:92-619(-)